MKLAIMQPYFFPYPGYFQLMSAVDEFVVYDNIEFTKKGWINRNRILVNGKDSCITLPLKKDSDFLDIGDRRLAGTWGAEKTKMLNRIAGAYRKAPQFDLAYPVVEECLSFGETNLFKFILNSLAAVRDYLGIRTPLTVSSAMPGARELKAEKKIFAICRARKADAYLNPVGGLQLYRKEDFKAEGLDLGFLRPADREYRQYDNAFVPRLSIIDAMMFNSKEELGKMLGAYALE